MMRPVSTLIYGLLGVTVVATAVAWAPHAAAQAPAEPGRGVQAAPQRGGRGGRQGNPDGTPNEGRGQGGPALKIVRDVEYSRAGAVPLTLDLYHVEPLASPSPVVVWIHGTEGSFTTKGATPAAGLVSAGSGLAVASIEYRTGPGTTLAMQLADAKASVQWLRDHAAAYNLDPAHIAAFGYGVGGQIAALLGAGASVQAFIDVAGPVTKGGLNPATSVTKDSAPGLLIHGTADTVVSTRESQALIAALKVSGVNATLDMQVGVGHDLGALLSPLVMQRVAAVLAQHLQGAPGNAGLSAFIATPAETYIDPVGLDLGGTQYRLYPTPSRGPNTLASYRVYLPPDYQTNANRRYPVIYFLHGRSVDSKRPITSGYITRVDAAIRSGVMPPAIVVLSQGLTTGWYVDAQDGKHPMESVIVKDLVAHVDATYRTIATREGRAIEGHSMGGFGALHIGFKHPDLFAAVTGNSPALVENVTDGVGDQAFWVAQSPATLAKANIDKVRKQAIRIIVGDQDGLFPLGKKLDETLTSLNIQHQFFPVAGSPHNHDQLLQFETFDTMAFYATVFGKAAGSPKP